jgi:ABC-type transporter Mla subunit MlaD
LGELASGAERQSLAAILQHTEKITATIAGRNIELDTAIRDAARLLDTGTAAGKQLEDLFEKINRASEGILEMSRQIGRQAEQVGDKSVRGIAIFERDVQDTKNILRSVAVDLQTLISTMQELVIDLKRNPDLLIKGRPPQPAGPGE